MTAKDWHCSFCGQQLCCRPMVIASSISSACICVRCVSDCVRLIAKQAEDGFVREVDAGVFPPRASLHIEHSVDPPDFVDWPVKPPRPPP